MYVANTLCLYLSNVRLYITVCLFRQYNCQITQPAREQGRRETEAKNVIY